MRGYLPFGDTETDIIALLRALPGGSGLANKFVDLENLIKAKAKEGAEEAIPDIKAEVSKTVKPYVIVAIILGGIGAFTGIRALRMASGGHSLKGAGGYARRRRYAR